MSTVSTHVLDTVRGEPASGILVRLERADGGELGRALTDADGRISDFGVADLTAGTYRLVFETGPYLSAQGEPFFPEIVVTFAVDGQRPKYHVPLLLSPFSYSTYRGS
jgi:5-hydroxyisourate hydrolase